MKIRFILDIYSSKADVYGNRYHVAQLTSTRTGRSVWFWTHSESNARVAVAHALDQRPSEFMHVTEQTLPIREFNRLVKWRAVVGAVGPLNEDDLSAEILADLEDKGRKRKKQSRLYVGCNASRSWEVFRATEKPTCESHGAQYAAVIGPFRTRAGAEFMRDHGYGNPHCATVADAERLAREHRS